MTQFNKFVGVDIASASFTACVGVSPWKLAVKPETFDNDENGYSVFLSWMKRHDCSLIDTVVCMEATGVYGEGLAYFLCASGFTVAVEPPLNIQRKFPINKSKNDLLDSTYIAEYACRYVDKLAIWKPRDDVLEQVKVLLASREQFVGQSTAQKNALHAINRKKVSCDVAKDVHKEIIKQIEKHIATIDAEIRRLINSDPTYKRTFLLLLSLPGVGAMLAAHLLIITQYTQDPRVLATFIGISPIEHESGSSIKKTPTSRHYGPPAIRKLLFLAACSVRQHRKQFQLYFARKTAEGKAKKLIINNIQNKLLKIACAVLREQKPYIANYVSVNPLVLKNA
ncbi:MAG: IS110 family transposase [Chloroflexota bacterium]